ncbi:MAG: lipoprotein insertase outer membrane protein LolB [Gammaproteobacteria bacterium]
MRLNSLLIIVLSALWLASCTTVTEQAQTPVNQSMSWNKRVDAISKVQAWNVKGMIAIHEARDAVSATLQWQQKYRNYHIALFGPLGSNSYELTGQPGRVELAGANGKRAVASTPEALLAQQAGWHLPVSNLYYWIRGIPVPSLPAQKQLDAYNHLIQLNQDGWSIRYLRYTSVNNTDLPSKIFLDNPQLNVKIVISQWQI